MGFRRASWLLLFGIALVAQGCGKGDTGPTGPAGAIGATGVTGGTGPTGSANVIYSRAFQPGVAPDAAWAPRTSAGSIANLSFTMTSADFTQDNFDNGVLLVYANINNAWFGIPAAFYWADENWFWETKTGGLLVSYHSIATPGTTPAILTTYKLSGRIRREFDRTAQVDDLPAGLPQVQYSRVRRSSPIEVVMMRVTHLRGCVSAEQMSRPVTIRPGGLELSRPDVLRAQRRAAGHAAPGQNPCAG